MSDDKTTENKTISVAVRRGLAIAWTVVCMCLAVSAGAQPFIQFEDDNTQMKFSVPGGAQNVNVHICKGNALLIGVDVETTNFLAL
jgi:hypothetical protein